MNKTQKTKTIKKIIQLEKDIAEVERCRKEIAINGYSSATISSAGGSKSYTKLDLDKLTTILNDLKKELKINRQLLSNKSNLESQSIYTVYSL